MPPTAPILDEIHAVREKLAQESGNDPDRIAEAARVREAQGGRQAVTVAPRPPTVIKKKAS